MLKNANNMMLSAKVALVDLEVEDLAEDDLVDSNDEDLDELMYSLSDLVTWEILSNSLCEEDSDEQAAALAKVRISNYHSRSHLKRRIMVSPSLSTTPSMSLTPTAKRRE
jgi:hypothetical protein